MNQDRASTTTNSQLKEGYKQTEVGVIPEDWSISTVGEEFSIQLGKMLDADKNIGTPKPYLGNRSIQWGHIEIDNISLISLTPSDIQRFRLKKGDLLVCEGGESGRAAIWNNQINECYYQKALHRLRPNKGYNVFLMLCFLQRWVSIGFLSDFITQTSIAHLPKEKFEQVPLLVPPLPEQEAIACTLSDIDALIESLDRLLTKKRQIKQGAMQELLTGKKRLPKFDNCQHYIQTEIGVIPKDWHLISLTTIADVRDGTHDSPKYVKEGVPFITSKNIVNGNIDFQDIEYISTEDAYQVNKRSKVDKDDILMSMIGTVGNVASVDFDLEFCIKNVALIKPIHSKIEATFLTQLFRSDFYGRYVTGKLDGGIQKFISLGILRCLDVPLPPTKDEQIDIANILSDMDAEIGSISAKLAKTRQLKQGMMHELLTGRIRLVES